MEPIHLFILDMAHATNTTGVNRYVNSLLEGLEAYPFIRVCWIQLRHDRSILFPRREETASYLKITLPLPQHFEPIIRDAFWIRRYNMQIYRLIRHLFEKKPRCILHLHTLNLIELALYIRQQVPCKIISHLHCIPWKSAYNTNRLKFNRLYLQSRTDDPATLNPDDFMSNVCEKESYLQSDYLICVTDCAVRFLKDTVRVPGDKIVMIPNGLADSCSRSGMPRKSGSDSFRCLYAGAWIESKGLGYILQSLRIVQRRGHRVSLTIAGKSTPEMAAKVQKENRDLSLNILGCIPFEELKQQYAACDLGIIGSLQEQSSYVAIEMAMYGLPIVTTAVDGLDEMFTDGRDALKVVPLFSRASGLTVPVETMAEKVIRLITDRELREKLGANSRKLYEENFKLEYMVERTVEVYCQVAEEGGEICV